MSHALKVILSVLALLGAGLLVYHSCVFKAETDLRSLRWSRRYWEDVNAALLLYGEVQTDATTGTLPEAQRKRAWEQTRDVMRRRARLAGIQPCQFWRTVRPGVFLRASTGLVPVRGHEDKGRAWLLSLGFRWLGGPSPYLLLWLAPLLYLPVLLVTLAELLWTRCFTTAAFLALLSGASPFVAVALELPHSGMGFYLAVLVALMGFAAHAAKGAPSWTSLIVRIVAHGLFFALCVTCRGNTALLFAGYAVALVVAAVRIRPRSPTARRLVLRVGALALLFLVPFTLMRDSHPRPLWLGIWEGLGDFDTSRGHVWSDTAAVRFYAEAGHDPGPRQVGWWLGEEGERFFRRTVTNEIREHPGWYLAILLKRLHATVTQEKLWPQRVGRGRSFAPSTTPNQGNMDSYYRLAPTADWLALGWHWVEVPAWLLPLPLLVLCMVALFARSNRSWHGRARSQLLVLVAPAVGALADPVLLSTASALETEAFVLVHFLALGLLVDVFLFPQVQTSGLRTSDGFPRVTQPRNELPVP